MKVPTEASYKLEDHWRWTNNKRNYETLVISYNNFEPEQSSYDYIVNMIGHKWNLIKDVSKIFPIDNYDYIGCVDDDLITDYQSFNVGLDLANRFNFQYWQLSMPPGSDLHPTYHRCLQQDNTCIFSETNFIEMGSPFFTLDKFKFLMDFLSHWDFKVGMGIDRVFYDLFKCPANVVHCANIHQPIRESYYDKTEATLEMYDFMYDKYAKILNQHYGRESHFVDSLNVFKKFKLVI
ncbi:hypothetical protein M0R04_05155 [Candidatus Dojkabacteria bacterium]|nr:hypothetical protein [Candidatus Dojkabacteria bacterium]